LLYIQNELFRLDPLDSINANVSLSLPVVQWTEVIVGNVTFVGTLSTRLLS